MLLGRPNIDTFTADKAVQVLTAIMAHAKDNAFTIQQVKLITTNLVAGQYRASQVGVLDGLSNLLKQDTYRRSVFEVFGIVEKILAVSVESPGALYRALFCLWVSSFNEDVLVRILAPRADSIVALLKSTFTDCRVEKILRIALAVVTNLVNAPSFSVAMVESGIVHAIQPLEYEKWRDAELYDAIRGAANRVAAETSRHSNFERYEKELRGESLKWGFIHSEKFWLENVNQFEKDNFAPVAQLVKLLASSDPETQAVACHDLGEFARLHPSGRRVIAKLNGKNAVMALMTNGTREVSKEALLCTQKLMLNQWQKVNAPQVKAK
jgi:V-type H+-transporting ATPase subunit H